MYYYIPRKGKDKSIIFLYHVQSCRALAGRPKCMYILGTKKEGKIKSTIFPCHRPISPAVVTKIA
jgi:hypothetical protein